jgi:hemolysin-activating ACP:hemolysin acyltransferase
MQLFAYIKMLNYWFSRKSPFWLQRQWQRQAVTNCTNRTNRVREACVFTAHSKIIPVFGERVGWQVHTCSTKKWKPMFFCIWKCVQTVFSFISMTKCASPSHVYIRNCAAWQEMFVRNSVTRNVCPEQCDKKCLSGAVWPELSGTNAENRSPGFFVEAPTCQTSKCRDLNWCRHQNGDITNFPPCT